MFRLSQSTRRRLFRAGFLLVCVAPLVALAAAGWRQRLAGHIRAHENALRQSLGLRVQIGRVIHPRPGVVRYQDLELTDPETGHTIARCGVAEVREPSGAGKPTEVVVYGMAVEQGATKPLFGLIEQLLRGSFRSEDLYVSLMTDALTFDEAASFPQVKGVSGTIRSTERTAEARIEFRLATPDATAAAPQTAETARTALPTGIDTAATENKAMLRMVRNLQNGETIEGFEIHTGSAAIPCEALAPLAGGELVGLGGSRFQGSVWASHELAGWLVTVYGDLHDLNLQRLIGDRFGHTFDGKCKVKIHPARCVNGRLTEADMTIVGGPGRVSRSLLAAAADGLRFEPTYLPTPAQEVFPYRELAAAARISKQGDFRIAGRCAARDPRAAGTVLMGINGQPLWLEPLQSEQPQPVSGLLRALVAGEGPVAPANSQIAWLLARLPIETARRDLPRNRQPAQLEPPPPRREPPKAPRRDLPGPD